MDLDKLAKPFLKSIIPYQPGKPIEQLARERGIEGPIAKLASNENPYSPHATIKQAVMEAMESANRYPESGAPELTERLATLHGVAEEEIFVANGTNEILDLLVRVYVYPHENCVFSALSFAIYKLICMQCGVGAVEVPQRDYTHDLVAMASALSHDTKIVFICNPNNPTGTYNTSHEVKRFLKHAGETSLVVLDEAYYDFVDADDYPDSAALRRVHPQVVILRTFSKFYSLAGIRIGYAVADPAVVRALHKMRQPFNVNRLAQAAALAALGCRDELRPLVEETIRERTRLRERIMDLGCTCPPSQTNFLFVIPGDGADVCDELEQRGIIVRPMPAFGGTANSFRVNTGTPAENDRFLDALQVALSARR